MQLTYNDRNYGTISQEEWEYIAQAVVNHLSDSSIDDVNLEYSQDLRPTDAALFALGEADVFEQEIPGHYFKRTWQDWRRELGI